MPLYQPTEAAQSGSYPHGENTPAPCAWCAKEAGIVQRADGNESHTVCARHFCMTLLAGGLPAQAVKDRAGRMYGAPGLAAFNAAVQLLAREVSNLKLSNL